MENLPSWWVISRGSDKKNVPDETKSKLTFFSIEVYYRYWKKRPQTKVNDLNLIKNIK